MNSKYYTVVTLKLPYVLDVHLEIAITVVEMITPMSENQPMEYHVDWEYQSASLVKTAGGAYRVIDVVLDFDDPDLQKAIEDHVQSYLRTR